MGAVPIINSTNYLSEVISEKCVACGTCVDRCPMGAISLGDSAIVNPKLCIGCGLCAKVCPENAIRLLEGLRTVFVPPPKITS
ncbi:MAG: 4Fe-4S binding protein [Candidatus Lokiarchaeota archaeon]|nr:4Fe-4S binding protein [Candidatus Lokiarchaeota archaeon]